MVGPDGRIVWFHDFTAVLDEAAEASHLVGLLVDITERKRIEEHLQSSEARLRLLLSQTPAILWTADRDLRITSSVGAGLASLGIQPNEFVGRDVSDFFRSDDEERAAVGSHRRALRGESAEFEHAWNGRVFHIRIEPLRDGRDSIVGCLGIGHDITARNRV